MKNALNYYYGIKADDIHQVNNTYKFNIYGQDYALVIYDRDIKDIDELYKISTYFFSRGIYCHQIIPNNDNNLITYINQIPYILLQIYIKENKIITEDDIKLFTNYASLTNYSELLRRDNWKQLWINKIDYFEYQVSQFGKKYPLIRESFSYYCGFVETGISLINTTNLEYSRLVVGHKRLKATDTLFDLYNPLNFIIDLPIRDISEYYKDLIIEDNSIIDKIKNYILTYNLSTNEILMFFIRMLYPSFYFDLYEDIIENDKDDSSLLDIINSNKKYEKVIKELYIFLNNYIVMPDIEWIKKM